MRTIKLTTRKRAPFLITQRPSTNKVIVERSYCEGERKIVEDSFEYASGVAIDASNRF